MDHPQPGRTLATSAPRLHTIARKATAAHLRLVLRSPGSPSAPVFWPLSPLPMQSFSLGARIVVFARVIPCFCVRATTRAFLSDASTHRHKGMQSASFRLIFQVVSLQVCLPSTLLFLSGIFLVGLDKVYASLDAFTAQPGYYLPISRAATEQVAYLPCGTYSRIRVPRSLIRSRPPAPQPRGDSHQLYTLPRCHGLDFNLFLDCGVMDRGTAQDSLKMHGVFAYPRIRRERSIPRVEKRAPQGGDGDKPSVGASLSRTVRIVFFDNNRGRAQDGSLYP